MRKNAIAALFLLPSISYSMEASTPTLLEPLAIHGLQQEQGGEGNEGNSQISSSYELKNQETEIKANGIDRQYRMQNEDSRD